MARLIRANSETPNVANIDDYRLLRYAMGGYNGVLENYGNECSYTITGSDFKINSGVIFYQGVDSEILTAGETITIDNISGTQYYVVYLEIDLSDSANQTSIVKSSYETSDYPVISAGDDLTIVPTGLANFELYRFTASGGVISNVVQRFSLIEVGNVLHAENADLATNATNATNDSDGNPINTTYTKDSDFNTSSQTAFGDYIVEKKVLLWSGTATASTSVPNQTITLDSNISNGDFIEVNIESRSIKRHRFVAQNVGSSSLASVFISESSHFPITDGKIFYNYSTSINFPSTNTLNFKKTSCVAFVVPNALDSNCKTYTSDIQPDINTTLYSVYKIIE